MHRGHLQPVEGVKPDIPAHRMKNAPPGREVSDLDTLLTKKFSVGVKTLYAEPPKCQ